MTSEEKKHESSLQDLKKIFPKNKQEFQIYNSLSVRSFMFTIKSHAELIDYVNNFNMLNYCKTRNYVNGGVSYLSAYITHGVITIDEIVRLSLQQYTIDQVESWYKELLWREYFVQVHYHLGDKIFNDIDEDKTHIPKQDMLPEEITTKTRPVAWVNQTILQLETTGYLHNHQRMRFASYMTHRQKLYWKKLADWTYYHFVDGELGSNHLSWQWVASTFSHKPYFMNEENINRYRKGMKDPYLRGSYEDIEKKIFDPQRKTDVSESNDIYDSLSTDLTHIQPFTLGDIHHSGSEHKKITLLTPWDFHPDKVSDPDHTVCILDSDFLSLHPRSQKRIDFVQGYCELYNIRLYQGTIENIISVLLKDKVNISVYETRNPIYQDAYTRYKDSIDITPHHRCSPIVTQGYTKKFFPFWEKTSKYLYQLQREIHTL